MTYAVGVVQYQNGKSQQDKYDLIDDLYDYTNEVSNDVITVSMTGQAALIKDMNEESKKDVEKKDVITIPIALCVLAIIVRSWRLMFIPILTFGISICASFSIMRPFTNVLDVSPFAPSIMMSVSIAMSIDYSLFLLTRYREEVENKMKNVLAMSTRNNIKIAIDATKQTTRWSGKVVCLSGAILASTYLCLVAYPLSALQSMGLGASIAILCTILVNMTLTPSLLLIFPVFFSQFGANGCGCWRRKKQNSLLNDDDDDGLTNGHNNNDDNNNDNNNDFNNNYPRMLSANSPASNNHINKQGSISEEVTLEEEAKNANAIDRCWYICGMKSTTWPVSLILCIVVYALISTVGWKVLDIKKQLADTLIFPRDSPYLTTFNEVGDNFNPGLTAPWQILITSNTTKVTTPKFIDQSGISMHKFWTTLIKNNYQNSITGPAFFGIGPNIVDAFVFPSTVIDKIMDNAAINQSYEYITKSKINSDQTAVFYTMTTAFDPYYENAIEFVADAREYLSDACKYPEQKPNPVQYDCYLLGGSVAEVDSVNKTFGSFPWVLAIIICSVFTVMGFVFRSAFVPFRLLITIIYPMTFVYGLAIFVYQDGIFDGIGWEPIKGTDGLYWLIPVMTVTILVGLALYYDIFLFARIYEYRVIGGVPTKDAIVRGVFKTGSIITAAGIIMAIAFCGLMLSNITSLNQTGFILVVAVLVDTFVIRTSLVPAVLSMAKEVNWWPGSNVSKNNDNNNNNNNNDNINDNILNNNNDVQKIKKGLTNVSDIASSLGQNSVTGDL